MLNLWIPNVAGLLLVIGLCGGHIQDTGINQYFTGKIVNYDGALHGKCGVYFPSDGEVMYIYPDDEDFVFAT